MKWSELKPEVKTWIVRGLIVLAIIVIAIPLYNKKERRPRGQATSEVVDTDVSTFEKSILAQTKAELNDMEQSMKDFQDEMRKVMQTSSDMNRIELEKHKKALAKEAARLAGSRERQTKEEIIKEIVAQNQAQKDKEEKKRIFEEKKKPVIAPSDASRGRAKAPAAAPASLSGIANKRPLKDDGGRNKNRGKSRKKDSVKEVDEVKTVYLPPSFMKADLLSGVVAPTGNRKGGESSSPMIIRINDLAVLPNEYKRDTKGCFIIADGKADLSQERVMGRLVTLSCISKDGTSLIDHPVEGWLIDKDGRAGMRGKVVAKFGAHVARTAFAGFLAGFGEAFQESSYITTDNGVFGASRTLKDSSPSTLLRAGTGGGIVATAEDLEEFYLDLANQTLPVVEVGPTKQITVAISKGVNLEIKKRL